MNERPASEVYQPNESNRLEDAPDSEKNLAWGYSIGYEVNPEDQAVPEGGNTAVFRIHPQGMTEPVFVTKPEREATFTVNVLTGSCRLIRARADGTVDDVELKAGDTVTVHPGEAYVYKNTSPNEDLVLHDVARPAFQEGDEVELMSSVVPDATPVPKDGYSACVVRTSEGEIRTIEVPSKFYDLLAEAETTS
jgi:mannose-6-phosphate isomerase-like protein (cupin superfamily)